MYLILEFDLNMDLINVPAHIVTDKEEIRHKFLNWVYSSTNRKKYTKRIKRSDGTYLSCVCYGSEEFVCWLNRKCLNNGEDPATIIKKNIDNSYSQYSFSFLLRYLSS